MREAIVAIGPQWLAIGGLVVGFVFGAIVFSLVSWALSALVLRD